MQVRTALVLPGASIESFVNFHQTCTSPNDHRITIAVAMAMELDFPR